MIEVAIPANYFGRTPSMLATATGSHLNPNEKSGVDHYLTVDSRVAIPSQTPTLALHFVGRSKRIPGLSICSPERLPPSSKLLQSRALY